MDKFVQKVDFIGIGAQKSASSWIADCLQEHPDVCLPVALAGHRKDPGTQIKEMHFFDKDKRFEKGSEFYSAHFAHCDNTHILGEFTPMYLYDPKVPKRIHSLFPDVKLIACLRNPIDRAYSQYNYCKILWEGATFEEAIKANPEFLERGLYARQLKRYFELFPKEQIHISLYEDIQKDPKAFMQEMYRFLGIDDTFVPSKVEGTQNVSKTVEFKHKGIESVRQGARRTLRYSGLRPLLVPILRSLGFSRLEKKIQSMNAVKKEGVYPPMNGDTRDRLKAYYESDIEELEALLERELSEWR